MRSKETECSSGTTSPSSLLFILEVLHEIEVMMLCYCQGYEGIYYLAEALMSMNCSEDCFRGGF